MIASGPASLAYNRLRNAVYVTYPYARKAGIVMNDMNAKLVDISSESDRKNTYTPVKKIYGASSQNR